MKVLLINPPVDTVTGLEMPALVRNDEGAFPPLGLLYIAATLKKRSRCQVKILDTLAPRMKPGQVRSSIQQEAPDIVGITAHTHNLLDVITVARCIKEADSRTHVCLGGPHAALFPRESIEMDCVDSVVPGEGEEAFAELVTCLAGNGDLSKVKGLIVKRGGEIIQTGQRDPVSDLDSLPFPDRSLIDNKRYRSILGRKASLATIASSRGCPYGCTFCSTPKGPYRSRSARNIVDEMAECLRSGIGEVHFVDDTFNADTRRVEEICEEIAGRELKVAWSFRGRADKLGGALLEKVKAAGCARIHVGVEASTDEGLRELRKGITLEQVRQVFASMRKLRIDSVAYFLIGCPHEKTRGDVLRTIGFSRELDPDYALFNIVMPYPGTPLYRAGLSKGVFPADFWREFAVHPTPDFRPRFWEESFSREELVDLLYAAYRAFYLRPKFLGRALGGALRNPSVLIPRFRAGLQIVASISRRGRQ